MAAEKRLAWVTVSALLAEIGLLVGVALAAESTIVFSDVERQTREFMSYNRSIVLTREQERIKREALTALPAPCCSDRTAYTCCCQCNMARAWWGLANYLIAEKGMGADDVSRKVAEWFEFINPRGFSGESCYSGGCFRAFRNDGCGGMSEHEVVF